MSTIMDMNEADILAGRAKTVSAKYYDSESHEEIPYNCPDDEKVQVWAAVIP